MYNPFRSLKIDEWYKAMLALSTIFLLISLTVPLQAISHDAVNAVQLISLAGVLISLGEWINHPLQTIVGEHMGRMWHGEGHLRRNSPAGLAFDLIGACVLVVGLFKMLF
ncbi:hypothetical protein C7446_2344 [Kushneria sinocarnis]|uniref:Uncharacterized protein n=1 Tax=Kushneria sinocarnis TaxID=595502 RepID=A0A420WVP4_9GAMM|nr:hypothetical protein C7446_2344 [Kushneria sinocarnis]